MVAFSSVGISAQQAQAFQQQHGFNEIITHKPESVYKKILRQFGDILVILLIFAGGIAYFFGENVNASVIFSIVFVNATIGFIQEYKTEKLIQALKNLVAPTAQVIRDGKRLTIPAREVVVGDLIILEEGCKIPADAQLLEAHEFKVDEAILTGESIPVCKDLTSRKLEMRMVYAGTLVAIGSARARVAAIGGNTEFGKIAQLTTETEKSESPLTKEMKTIGAFVGKISLVLSLFLFGVGYFLREEGLIQSILFTVAVVVAAVPSGLPVTITTALALGVRRLVGDKALVRDLKSVETLGATTVICSDKTGTLTQNQMVVTRGWLSDAGVFKISGNGYNPTKGKVELVGSQFSAAKLFQIADLCNESELRKKGNSYEALGDPTEVALKVAAQKFGLTEKKVKRVFTFPFESERKCMSVVVGNTIFAKGAAEHLLQKCDSYLAGEKILKLTPQIRKNILRENLAFADQALRVLGCAYREVPKSAVRKLTQQTAEKGLVFVGLLAMQDAPRPEVAEAVSLCKQAGIRITIITGDYGPTAKAIAKEVGIAQADTPLLTGEDLSKLSERKLYELLNKKENIIFARMKPADKLRIVNAYKQLGEVVAVTGDGVNDAPALKRADIGVAMGITGSDVAKEAASLVLTDDSFASIVTAISEGRKIYNNMRKFILYIFSCNIGELVTVFFAILFNFPLPLSAVLILLVNLGTDLFPSLALGVDALEADAMSKPPRDSTARILQGGFIWHFLWLGFTIGGLVLAGYFWMLLTHGWEWGAPLLTTDLIYREAMTFAFATLVVIQLFNALNCRSEHNSIFSRLRPNFWLWGSIVLSILLVWVVVELPLAQKILSTTGLDLSQWLRVVILSSSILVLEELRKLLRKLFVKSPHAISV